MVKLGWIGLGSTGEPMVLRALAAGHSVIAHSRRGDRPAVRNAGGRISASLKEVVADADVVGVNVFDEDQVKEVLLGPGGAGDSLRPGTVVFIHSTISPEIVDELLVRLPKGVGVVDACFSGRAEDILAGRLTIIAGGEDDHIAKVMPVLKSYAERIFHVGPPGSGATLKVINNALFTANVRLAIEAVRAAAVVNISEDMALEVLRQSSGGSYAVDRIYDYRPIDEWVQGRMKEYEKKDVALAHLVADRKSLPMRGILAAASR